jgi:hypothetical protein
MLIVLAPVRPGVQVRFNHGKIFIGCHCTAVVSSEYEFLNFLAWLNFRVPSLKTEPDGVSVALDKQNHARGDQTETGQAFTILI